MGRAALRVEKLSSAAIRCFVVILLISDLRELSAERNATT
jgi:hypothetical protein